MTAFRFRFRLRSLLLAMTALGVCLACLNELDQCARRKRAADAIIGLGGRITYEYQLVQGGQPPGPESMRQLLGNNFFAKPQAMVIDGTSPKMSAAIALTYIGEFKELSHLYIVFAHLTSDDIEQIKQLQQLVRLEFHLTQLGEHEWKELRESLPNCTIVDVEPLPRDSLPAHLLDDSLFPISAQRVMSQLDLEREGAAAQGWDPFECQDPNAKLPLR